MNLAEQKVGSEYLIQALTGDPFFTSRLRELGFIPGEKVFFKSKVVFGEPLIVEVRGTQIALRKKEAECILVTP